MAYTYRSPYTGTRRSRSVAALPGYNISSRPRPLGSSGGGMRGVAAAPSTSRERGFPERVSLDLMRSGPTAEGVIARGVQLPAQIAERPLALANRLTGGVLTGYRDEMGQPSGGGGLLGAVGGFGIGEKGPEVGDVVNAAGNALERVGNFIPAFINGSDVNLLRTLRDVDDAATIPGRSTGGFFGIGGKPQTVGEFRAEMERRGFWGVDANGIDHGTYEEVIDDSKWATDFGDRDVNEDGMVDFAIRLAADPLNLLMGTGLGAKALGLAGRAAGAAGRAAPAWARAPVSIGRSALPRVAGRGYWADAVASNARVQTIVKTPQMIAREMSEGITTSATMRGLASLYTAAATGGRASRIAAGTARVAGRSANFMLNPRGYGSIKGYYQRSIALEAGGAILSGFQSPLQDFAQDVMNDNPLSQNSLVVMATAFKVPAKALVGDASTAMRGMRQSQFGPGTLHHFARELGTAPARTGGNAFQRAARSADETGYTRKAQADDMLTKLGDGDATRGRLSFQRLVDHIDRRIAWHSLPPSLATQFKSFEEFTSRGIGLEPILEDAVRGMRERGELTDVRRYEEFRRWHEDVQQTKRGSEGEAIQDVAPVKFAWEPDVVIRKWRDYEKVQIKMSGFLDRFGQVVVGRSKTLSRENVSDLLAYVESESANGRIPHAAVFEALRRAPSLIDMPGEHGAFWTNYLSRGAQIRKTGIAGDRLRQEFTPEIDAVQLIDELQHLRDESTPAQELFHEARAMEAGAPFEHTTPRPRLARLTSISALKRQRTRGSGFVRTAAAVLSPLEALYNRRYTKNGRLKTGARPAILPSNGGRAHDRTPAGLVEFTRARDQVKRPYVGNFSDISLRDWQRGEAYLSEDGKVGFLVKENGELANMFNNGGPTGAGKVALRDAIEMGATHLDAYDGYLTEKFYADAGFFETSRDLWDPQYANALGQKGDPWWGKDVVYMRLSDEAVAAGKAAREARGAGQRLVDKQALDGARAELATRTQLVNEIETRIDEIQTFKPDPSLAEDGKIPPDQLQEFREMGTWLRENAPQYDLEASPQLALRMNLNDGQLARMAIERTVVGRWLFEYGPLGRFSNFIEHLTSPVSTVRMARDARQMVMDKAIAVGVKPHTVDHILSKLRDEALLHTAGPQRVQFFRGITGLTPNAINQVAKDAITLAEDGTIRPEGAAVWKAMQERYGENGFHHLLDEASNSFIRRVDSRRAKGQKVGALSAALRGAYYLQQRGPTGGLTRMASKVLYHNLRFMADVRWHLLNRVEADMIAFVNDGFQTTRFGPEPGATAKAAMDYHGQQSDIGLVGLNPNHAPVKDMGDIAMLDDSGQYLFNRNLEPVVARHMGKRTLENVENFLNALPDEHPTIRALVQKYGPDRSMRDYATQLNDMMYRFDKNGVPATFRDEAGRIAREDGWTREEIGQMEPIIQRLTEINQRTFDDIVKMHQGNPSRSRIERILNSYWLYWPLSYQIKASKWLLGTLTDRAFGRQTNLGGAWTLDRADREFKERLATSAAYQQMVKENEDLWFMAGMVFPIVPWDLGVSLNRGVRYAGAALDNPLQPGQAPFFAEYEGIDNPMDWAAKLLQAGPDFSISLMGEVWTEQFGDGEPEDVDYPRN